MVGAACGLASGARVRCGRPGLGGGRLTPCWASVAAGTATAGAGRTNREAVILGLGIQTWLRAARVGLACGEASGAGVTSRERVILGRGIQTWPRVARGG